jgi:hypothetical protein
VTLLVAAAVEEARKEARQHTECEQRDRQRVRREATEAEHAADIEARVPRLDAGELFETETEGAASATPTPASPPCAPVAATEVPP